METKTIVSDRLILRKVKKEDASSLFNNWDSDVQMHKYVGYDLHTDVSQTEQLIEKWIDEYKNGRLTWVIELKNNKEIIGVISASNNKLDIKESEIGFSIGTKYQGNGYAQEAAKSIINYLLNEIDIVKGGCLKSNIKSANVMMKVGMKKYKEDKRNEYYYISRL